MSQSFLTGRSSSCIIVAPTTSAHSSTECAQAPVFMQGLACVADPKCRIETMLARAITSHAPGILEPLPADVQAIALRVILDTHTVKGCVSPELQQVLRSEPFWRSVHATVEAAADGMSAVMLTGLLETLLIVQRLSPKLRGRIGGILRKKVGEYAAQAADCVILMHMPAGRRDADAAMDSGAEMLLRVREVAKGAWGGREFREALGAALRRDTGLQAPVRPGVWAVAAMVDELATAKAGELAAEDVYAIDSALEQLRYAKSKVLEKHLVGKMPGRG